MGLAVFIILFISSSSAVELTVCSSECDYTTIQGAIDAANPGDTILVGDGTYTENVYVYKELTIRSENGPTSTIVQAANPNSHIFEINVSSVDITGFTITGVTGDSNAGIYLKNADYCTISNNDVSNNYDGILLENSFSNTLINNNANSNSLIGIYLNSSFNNNIINNNASSNGEGGVALLSSSNNTVTDNNIKSNNWAGIELYYSSNNTITNNNVNSNNRYGIYSLWDPSGNTITNNNINNNLVGIYLDWSPRNLIYHNNFINNTSLQAYSNKPGNYFNNLLGEGNYWSDILTNGLDLVDSNDDGIYDSGSQYPYSMVNGGHVSTYVVDYGPYVDQGNWTSIKTYNIPLISGWNLISTPIQPENVSIKAVLGNLTGGIIVTTYNTTADEWHIYDSDSSETATLTEIVAGWGYWMYSENDQILTITGTTPVSPDIDLYPGWNLIGHNYLIPKSISDVVSDEYGPIVVLNHNADGDSWGVYNSTAPEFLNAFTEMEPGRGYWISVTSIP